MSEMKDQTCLPEPSFPPPPSLKILIIRSQAPPLSLTTRPVRAWATMEFRHGEQGRRLPPSPRPRRRGIRCLAGCLRQGLVAAVSVVADSGTADEDSGLWIECCCGTRDRRGPQDTRAADFLLVLVSPAMISDAGPGKVNDRVNAL